jgi:hypothetical protein
MNLYIKLLRSNYEGLTTAFSVPAAADIEHGTSASLPPFDKFEVNAKAITSIGES